MFYDFSASFASLTGILFGIFLLWVAIWKGLGLWHSARNRQMIWFIAMLILSTAGILPIIYLLFFRRNRAKAIIAEMRKAAPKKRRKVKRKVKRKKKRRR